MCSGVYCLHDLLPVIVIVVAASKHELVLVMPCLVTWAKLGARSGMMSTLSCKHAGKVLFASQWS